MSVNVVTLDGVSLQAAGLRARDCAWPITDMMWCILQDEVLRNMPIYIGEWENGTIQPGIVDQTHEIVIPENLDVCDSPTVKTVLEGAEFELPNQKDMSLCSEQLVIRDMVEKACRGRNILPDYSKKMFNADGSFRMGEPYTANFMRIALSALTNAPGELLLKSALVGDEANYFEFDGLYTQIDNGWTTTAPANIADPINLGQVIDWSTLTGVAPLASPDDVTIAGQTVNLWGTVYDVPEGMNLAQFIEDLWIEAVELNFTQRYGGVEMWEMHVPWGQARCFLNTAACMRPCTCSGDDCHSIFGMDEDFWARIREYRSRNVATLQPSGTTFPLLQTRYMEPNTIRFGPSMIGGYRTYGLFFRDYNQILDSLAPMRNDLYGQSFGVQWEYDPIIMRRNDILRNNVEASALYVDITKQSSKCLQVCLEYEAGLLALCRNLWLRIDNVTCNSFVCDPDSGVTIEEQPGQPTPL